LFTALIVLLVSCSSALLTSSSNQPPNITNYFCEKHQLFLTTLPKYIKKWIPEFRTKSYPKPILEHKKAREKVLKVYKDALDNLD